MEKKGMNTPQPIAFSKECTTQKGTAGSIDWHLPSQPPQYNPFIVQLFLLR
jgi:hypothetical protein